MVNDFQVTERQNPFCTPGRKDRNSTDPEHTRGMDWNALKEQERNNR